MVTVLFGLSVSERCEAGVSLSTRTSLRECERKERQRRGGEKEARLYTGWLARWGVLGGAERWRWDEEPTFPCSENRSAEKGGCCSRPSQLVAPFHNSLIFDWTCRAWTGGELDCIPTRGTSLCGTSGHLLARVWLEPRRFSLTPGRTASVIPRQTWHHYTPIRLYLPIRLRAVVIILWPLTGHVAGERHILGESGNGRPLMLLRMSASSRAMPVVIDSIAVT